MKTTRDLLRTFWNNLHRITLAMLLSVLVVALIMQLCRHLEISALIRVVGDIETDGVKETLPPTPEGVVYLVAADPGRYWQEHYSTGDWRQRAKNYQVPEGTHQPVPFPGSMTPELKDHLDQFGEGSLLDPSVYVTAIGREANVVGYWTRRSHEQPFRVQDPPEAKEEKEPIIDPTPLPVAGNEPEVPTLCEWLRWKQPCEPTRNNLNFTLSTVIKSDPKDKSKWDVTFKIYKGRKSFSRFLRIGTRIPGTDYVLREVNERVVEREAHGIKFPRPVFQVVVSHRDGKGDALTIGKGQRLPDPRGEAIYQLIFLPKPDTVHKLKPGDTISLAFDGKAAEYRMVVKDKEPRLIAIGKQGSEEGDSTKLRREQADDRRVWAETWGELRTGTE